MSLILDALKKLDREKQAPDRGLVVVGPSAWPSLREGRPALGAGAVALAVVALAGIGATLFMLRSGKGPQPATQPRVEAGPAAVSAPQAVDAAPGRAAVAPARPAPPVPAAPRAGTPTTAPAAAPVPAAAGTNAKAGSAPTSFQLQAISAQDGHPVAILNDRLVREGDSFNGVQVLRIGAEEVEIEVAGHRRVVKF